MSTNYNPYNYISHLNLVAPINTVPEQTPEDIDAHLGLWSNTRFTFDIPPGISLLEDDYEIPSNVDAKFDRDITTVSQPTSMIVQDFPQSPMYQSIFTYSTPSTILTTQLQPISMAPTATTSNNATYTPIYPAPTANASSSIISSKEDPASTTATPKNTNPPSRKNSTTRSILPASADSPRANTKSATVASDAEHEQSSKVAAEEDKRRRNTAASARFRVKKKMREQALERTAREMTSKAETLEGRVKELEMEIKWLRSLIVEKDARLLDIDRPEKKRRAETANNDVDKISNVESSYNKKGKKD